MLEKPTLKSSLKALLYMSPMLAIILTFNIYPIFRSFMMSFYAEYNFFQDIVGRYGLDNFQYIFTDSEFWLAIRNTFLFVLGVVPASIVISLFIAILLNKIKFLSGFSVPFTFYLS